MSASASKKKRKELDEQGLSPKVIAAQKEKEKKQKTLRNVLITLLCVALSAVAVFAVIKLVNRPEPPSYDTTAALATVGEEKITVPMYDYFYNGVVNQEYSSTLLGYLIQPNTPFSKQTNESFWEGTLEDHFKDSTKNAIQAICNFYTLAKQDGVELDEEQETTISDSIKAIQEDAETYGFNNVDRYLIARYGEGCDLDTFKEYLKISLIASAYSQKLHDEFQPTADELQAAYDEDPDVFDEVTFTYIASNAESLSVPTSGSEEEVGEDSEEAETAAPTITIYTDEAKAEAKEKAEGYLTEMPEDTKPVTYKKDYAKSLLNEEIANWLFDAERKEGDAKVFTMNEDETSFRTVRFESRETHEYHPVNANIITIAKDKEDAELEEGQKSAKAKLDELLNAVKDGMSDDEFSTAVTALSYTDSTVNVKNSDYSEELRTWLFDENRKNGDLFTEYSDDTNYYVVRYVSTDKDTYRDSLIRDSLWEKKSEEISKAAEIVINEDLMQYANTDLTFYDNSSSES